MELTEEIAGIDSDVNARLSEAPQEVFPPLEAYRYFPPRDEIFVTIGKSTQRVIFLGGVEYDDAEIKAIIKFKTFMAEKKLTLEQEVPDSDILRFLQAGSFDNKASYECLKNYVEWRISNIPPVLNDLCEELIRAGFLYIHGRDKKWRPLIVLNPTALLQFKHHDGEKLCLEVIKCCVFVIEYMQKNIFLPGQIENYILIVDVNRLGVTEIPKSTLAKVIDCLSKGYRYRSKRMYVLNTTWAIKIAWKVIEKFMADHMRKKMTLSDKNTMDELVDSFHPSQLEVKFGGSAPNATVFWPPIMPSTEYGIDKKILVSEEEYLKIIQKNTLLTPRPDLTKPKEETKDIISSDFIENKNKDLIEEQSIKMSEDDQSNIDQITHDCGDPISKQI